MLNASEIYSQLNQQVEKWGYCSLSQEERFFLKRYKALHITTGSQAYTTKAEQLAGKEQRTWSGSAPASKPKRRRTARARVWVDKSVATWKAPEPAKKEGISVEQLLSGMPGVYQREKQQACC